MPKKEGVWGVCRPKNAWENPAAEEIKIPSHGVKRRKITEVAQL